MAYVAEPIPPQIIKDALNDNWVQYLEIPKPYIIEANQYDEPYARFNLNSGDHIIIRQDPSGMSVRYRSTFNYYDRTFGLFLEIWTRISRQRLYDIMATIRRICFTIKHNDSNQYQLIRFISFIEFTNTEQNIWHGQIRINFEDWGKTADTV